ncbi:hypothetical protein BN1110_06325 [bacterium YEK0313]|nr:hypothetical protein BN1110_06325 [bacterium YEK0313]
MAETFIDVRENEFHWNGEIGAQLRDPDGLSGTDLGLRFENIEIVLTITQAISLFDALDSWLNAGPAKELGAIENRLVTALKATAEELDNELLQKNVLGSSQKFARILKDQIKLVGLRFRVADDPPLHLERPARRPAAPASTNEPTEGRA